MLQSQIALQYPGVAPLHARGHRAAHVGKRLVPVEAAQLDVLAVQHEAGRRVPCLAETDAGLVLVLRAVRVGQVNDHAVELRIGQAPEVDVRERIEIQIVILGLSLDLGAGCFQHLIAVEQLRAQRRPARRTLQIAAHGDRTVRGQGPHRFGVHVVDKRRRNDAQLDVAVDAAEGQVVDSESEGRDVRALPRIQFHGDHVVAIVLQMRGQLEAERRVAALVLFELVAVDRDGGGGHGSAEIQEDALALPAGHGPKVPAVGGDELKLRFVETVPGQADVGVRQGDLLPRGIVETGLRDAWERLAAEPPVAIQLVGAAARIRLRPRALGLGRQQAGRGGPEEEHTAIKLFH